MHINGFFLSLTIGLTAMAMLAAESSARERWSAEQANAWYRGRPWLVGANYAPASAINQLEMWQADSFDPARIELELAWAESLGFTSMRVFLHHLPYEADPAGFLQRMDKYLEIAQRHHIGTMFVLFDSCWDPNPKLGTQRAPQPGLHNSGWVQCPGAADLTNPQRHKVLEAYVKGVVGRFKDDQRIHSWDLWNEPDNQNDSSYGKNKLKQEPENKLALTLDLLKQAFTWARQAEPSQPITSGVWIGVWPDPDKLSPTERVQIEQSDIISFHNYGRIDQVKQAVGNLQRYNRPILCTEYMARPQGSTFDPVMGYFKEQNVAAYNWGFVSGKSQTIYPWDSWQKPYAAEPPVWFHDIFRTDGTPYELKEVQYIRKVTGVPVGSKPISLWPDVAPGEKGNIGEETDTTKADPKLPPEKYIIRLGNVSKPSITLFRPSADKDTGAAVVVCPGGGYHILANDLEGTEVCQWLNSIGVTGVLLKYRVPVRQGQERYAPPLQDVQRAIGIVRHRAKEWNLDPKRIGVMGFSAGGHLAATVSTNYETRTYPVLDAADEQSCRPDFTILIYPAYLAAKEDMTKLAPEIKVNEQTPPAFIAMAQDDPVRVENVYTYALAMKNAKVACELHLYPTGGHGYGLRPSASLVTTWPARAGDWMRSQGLLMRP